MTTVFVEYLGEDVWFDLPVKRRSDATLVNLNVYPDIELLFTLEGSELGILSLQDGDMTLNADGSARIKLSNTLTADWAAGSFKAWAKIRDAFGNEEIILNGVQRVKYKDNPLKGN